MANRIYAAEFRAQAVELSFLPGKSVIGAARDLGINPKTLHFWRHRARKNASVPTSESPAGPKLPDEVAAELRAAHPPPGPRRRARMRAPGLGTEDHRARPRSAGLVDFIGRDFTPERPGKVLYPDITYDCWTYLVLFTDGCSRRIVSWEAGTVMDTAFVLHAFEKALTDLAPEPGQLLLHSDRGSQYTSKAFRDRCFEARVIPSVGRTGSSFDNAQAESTNATIKKELINLRTWKNPNDVRLIHCQVQLR